MSARARRAAVRRVYRATAFYRPEDYEPEVTRHFLTKRARDQWAQRRREGREEEPGVTWDDDGRPALPPALRVQTADSEPVVFPRPDPDDDTRGLDPESRHR